MVNVTIEGSKAVFEVQASHKIWALKSRLEIPLSHIKRVYAEPNPPMGWFDGWKLAGADIPNVFRAGTFWLHNQKVFFDVRHAQNAVAVELEDEDYTELIIEVEDPATTVQTLDRAIHSGS